MTSVKIPTGIFLWDKKYSEPHEVTKSCRQAHMSHARSFDTRRTAQHGPIQEGMPAQGAERVTRPSTEQVVVLHKALGVARSWKALRPVGGRAAASSGGRGEDELSRRDGEEGDGERWKYDGITRKRGQKKKTRPLSGGPFVVARRETARDGGMKLLMRNFERNADRRRRTAVRRGGPGVDRLLVDESGGERARRVLMEERKGGESGQSRLSEDEADSRGPCCQSVTTRRMSWAARFW